MILLDEQDDSPQVAPLTRQQLTTNERTVCEKLDNIP